MKKSEMTIVIENMVESARKHQHISKLSACRIVRQIAHKIMVGEYERLRK